MWYIYILYSKTYNRTYVGFTGNLQKRLFYHNAGKVKATKHGRPWKLIYTEKFNSYDKARKREQYFKTGGGRRKIKKIFENLNLQ